MSKCTTNCMTLFKNCKACFGECWMKVLTGGLWLVGFSLRLTCHFLKNYWFLFADSFVYILPCFLHSAFPLLILPNFFPFLSQTHAHSRSHSYVPLSLSDSYPRLFPLSVNFCLAISLPITSTVHVCVLACASMCKHVSGLPWGGLVFLAHPRVLHSYPRPLYLSTFSFHFVYLRKVIGGLLNSLLVSLSYFREFGCVGRPEDGPWSLRAAKDSCFVNSERH